MDTSTHKSVALAVPIAAKLFGLRALKIENWIRAGLVPVVAGKLKRRIDRIVELPGLLAIGLIKSLAQGGNAHYEIVRPACEYLASMSTGDIYAAIDEGRTWLVSAGDAMEPRLVVPGTPIRNRTGATQLLFIFDLVEPTRKIERALAARNEAENG